MSPPSNDDAITEDEAATLFLPAIVDPRSLPVRFSRLKLMSQSAAHYYAACQRQQFEETIAMRIGSGVHAMLLGQSVCKYEKRRAGKEWEAFAAEHAKEVILNAREWTEAQAMAASLLRHREACALLFDDTIIEQEIAWNYGARACSSRPDARGRYHICELKTARTSNPSHFIRDAIRMHYNGQLSFYEEANIATGGERYANAYVIAIEKVDPYPVTLYRLTERALEHGRKLTRLWMETLLGCEDAHYWPAYSESIVDLDVPEDDVPIELEIDGQLVEVFAVTRALPSYVSIDYINTAGVARSHLMPAGSMRTLCGINIEGKRGELRGFEYPAKSDRECQTCPRYAAFYAAKETA